MMSCVSQELAIAVEQALRRAVGEAVPEAEGNPAATPISFPGGDCTVPTGGRLAEDVHVARQVLIA